MTLTGCTVGINVSVLSVRVMEGLVCCETVFIVGLESCTVGVAVSIKVLVVGFVLEVSAELIVEDLEKSEVVVDIVCEEGKPPGSVVESDSLSIKVLNVLLLVVDGVDNGTDSSVPDVVSVVSIIPGVEDMFK